MAMTNEDMPELVYLCNECDEVHHDEVTECERCEGTIREVTKGDMGYID